LKNCHSRFSGTFAIDRFTTRRGTPSTWGEALELRIGNQNSNFRNNNPSGTYTMPELR